MAAYIYAPTKEQWEVIQDMLGTLDQGGIIVPPETQKEYVEQFGPDWQEKLDEPIDFDFGGDADYWIDVARDLNMGDAAIRRDLGDDIDAIEDDEDDEDD